MKLTVCLSASVVALLALPAGVRAAGPDAPVNPYANLDPDGVPLAVTQNQEPSTTAQMETLEKQQADAEGKARNWLLLEYEQQFRRSSTTSSSNDRTMKMYLQLSMHNDLAAVANMAEENSRPTPSAPPLHATSNVSAKNNVGLRPDTTPGPGIYRPLFNPLYSPVTAAAIQPFNTGIYATALPKGLAPTASVAAPPVVAPAPTPRRTLSPISSLPTDTIDVQTPGLIADKANPLPGPDLSLDSLPDPTRADAQNSQPPELPQVPEVMDENLLHEQQTVKLSGLTAAQAKAKAQQPEQQKATPATPPPPEAPSPISKQPQLSPVHAPLPNPFDILNH